MKTHLVRTGSGRRLDVVEAGDPRGRPIVVHHGTPGCKNLAAEWVSDAESRGVRLISFSRAGYGRSSRVEGRDVAQVVADLTVVLDHLGVERFASWGLSGGGPHVLACASLMPDRVVAAACLSGVAPYAAEGLNWMEGMGEDNREEFGQVLAGSTDQLLESARAAAAAMANASQDDLVEGMRTLLSDEDARVARGPFGTYLLSSMVDGLGETAFGQLDDDLAFMRPWGFELSRIRVPTQVWQGGRDLMVPSSHGRWLSGAIPGADAHLNPDFGHLTVPAEHIPEVHSWLVAHF